MANITWTVRKQLKNKSRSIQGCFSSNNTFRGRLVKPWAFPPAN